MNDLPKGEPPSPKWFLAAGAVLLVALVAVKVGDWALDSGRSSHPDASADPIAAHDAGRGDPNGSASPGDGSKPGSAPSTSTGSSPAAGSSSAAGRSTASPSSPTTRASSGSASSPANASSGNPSSKTVSGGRDGQDASASVPSASPSAPTSLNTTTVHDLVSQWVDMSSGASSTATGAPDLNRLNALATPEFAARSIPALQAYDAIYRWQVVTPSQFRVVVTSVSGSASGATVQTCVYNDDWLVERASGRVVTNEPRSERTTWQLTRDASGAWRIADASQPNVTAGADTCPH